MNRDERMILRWRAGDQHAAEALYDLYRTPLYRLAYGLLGNAHDAEEAMQDTLLYALKKIEAYDAERASFKTWLHTICVSRCRNMRRRKRFSLTALADWLSGGRDVAIDAPGTAASAEITQRNQRVLAAVQTLPDKQREAILLRFWAGHSYPEIAAILDCPATTAKSRVQAAYRSLRLALTDLDLDRFSHEVVR